MLNNICSAATHRDINRGSHHMTSWCPIIFFFVELWGHIILQDCSLVSNNGLFCSYGTAEGAWRRQMLLLLLLLTVLRWDNTQLVKVMTTWRKRALEKSSRWHVGNCSCFPVKLILVTKLKLPASSHDRAECYSHLTKCLKNTSKTYLEQYFRDMIIWPIC